MTAYVVFLREGPIQDATALVDYQRLSRENKGDFNLKPLSVYGALEALEGDAPDGVVLLEFPTIEDARAWYNSPGYQAAVPHRVKSAAYRAFIVKGL